MSYKPTREEIMQILAYLASPAGAKVFQEIIDKPDDYRIRLKIPEAGGTFSVKLSAGSIRQLVRQTIGQNQDQTAHRGIDRAIEFPPTCELAKKLVAEHPEFLSQISDLRVIDVQHWADQFHLLHPDNTVYDAVIAFPNVTPLGQSWVMEFRPPAEIKAVGFARVATIFAALPTEPNFRLPPDVHIRPAWAMSSVIVFQGEEEIKWLPAQLVYYVAPSGELVVRPGREFCSLTKMYPDTKDVEIQHWTSFRDWFLAPCLHALCQLNSAANQPS